MCTGIKTFFLGGVVWIFILLLTAFLFTPRRSTFLWYPSSRLGLAPRRLGPPYACWLFGFRPNTLLCCFEAPLTDAATFLPRSFPSPSDLRLNRGHSRRSLAFQSRRRVVSPRSSCSTPHAKRVLDGEDWSCVSERSGVYLPQLLGRLTVILSRGFSLFIAGTEAPG